MFLSPPEIQHQKLKSRLGNYDREDVDRLLETIAASYEQVWDERDAARARVAELEQSLSGYEELERHLRDSVLTGQRAAAEVKAEAARKAEALVENARTQAAKIVTEAEHEREKVTSEIGRLRSVERDVQSNCRAILVGALEALGSDGSASLDPENRRREPTPSR